MYGELELMASRPALLTSVLVCIYTLLVFVGFYALRTALHSGAARFTGWNVHGQYRYGNDLLWVPLMLMAPIVAVTAIAIAWDAVPRLYRRVWILAMICLLILRTAFMLSVWNTAMTWPFLYGNALRSWLPDTWNNIDAYTAIDAALFGAVLFGARVMGAFMVANEGAKATSTRSA